MFRSALSLALAVGVCLFAAGCGTPGIKPKGKVDIVLEGPQPRSEHGARYLDAITITLPPAPRGYVWDLAMHNANFLKQTGNLTPPATPGGGATITFIAVTQGATRLRFLLLPENRGREAKPVDMRELLIEID